MQKPVRRRTSSTDRHTGSQEREHEFACLYRTGHCPQGGSSLASWLYKIYLHLHGQELFLLLPVFCNPESCQRAQRQGKVQILLESDKSQEEGSCRWSLVKLSKAFKISQLLSTRFGIRNRISMSRLLGWGFSLPASGSFWMVKVEIQWAVWARHHSI